MTKKRTKRTVKKPKLKLLTTEIISKELEPLFKKYGGKLDKQINHYFKFVSNNPNQDKIYAVYFSFSVFKKGDSVKKAIKTKIRQIAKKHGFKVEQLWIGKDGLGYGCVVGLSKRYKGVRQVGNKFYAY